jgi:hypothetical protein
MRSALSGMAIIEFSVSSSSGISFATATGILTSTSQVLQFPTFSGSTVPLYVQSDINAPSVITVNYLQAAIQNSALAAALPLASDVLFQLDSAVGTFIDDKTSLGAEFLDTAVFVCFHAPRLFFLKWSLPNVCDFLFAELSTFTPVGLTRRPRALLLAAGPHRIRCTWFSRWRLSRSLSTVLLRQASLMVSCGAMYHRQPLQCSAPLVMIAQRTRHFVCLSLFIFLHALFYNNQCCLPLHVPSPLFV